MVTAVTGASGYLGGAVVRALLAEGRVVRAIDLHRGPALDGLDIEFAQGDVLDSASLNHALSGVDVLYHLAAIIAIAGEPREQVWTLNVEGAGNVAQAALRSGVRRMVHCSSVHAYDLEAEPQQITEDAPRTVIKSRPLYDRSKAAGEGKVRDAVDAGLDAVIVNPTGIIGPLDFAPSRMGHVFIAMFTNRLPALVKGGFDWVDVRDVAASMIRAEKRGRTGENYLLSGHYASIEELAGMAAAVSGVETTARSAPLWLARLMVPFGRLMRGPNRDLSYTSDALHALRYSPPISGAKSATELGHKSRSTSDSVRDIHQWFSRRGALEDPDS